MLSPTPFFPKKVINILQIMDRMSSTADIPVLQAKQKRN
jgi:hypothetical protein